MAGKGAPGRRNRVGGIPALLMTGELHKALKQYERVDEDDPKKTIKRGKAIRKIMDNIVQKAVDGDMTAIQFCVERMEGKAKQVTEEIGTPKVSGPIQITFQTSEGIDVTPKPEVIEHDGS